MSLLPSNPNETEKEEAALTLTGVDVTGGDREHVLEALRLNRQILHEPQPDAEVDKAAVCRTIDALLDRL